MKTKKLLTLIAAPLLLVMVLLIAGCSKDDPKPTPGLVVAEIPEFTVVGVATKLTDKSEDAASRTWTIQDGTPATSTGKSVDVVFSSKGSKTIKLDVVFDNGTEGTQTFTIEVADELNAEISTVQTVSWSAGSTDISVSVKFTATVIGEPTGYSWVFPGGTPATSTEVSPTVVWVGGGKPEVSLTVSRSTDLASLEVKSLTQVGPANLWTNEFWGFEAADVVPNLQTWDGDNGTGWASGVVTALNTGFDGKAIEINYPGNTGYYGVISRDKTPSNAKLELNDIVLFSFYAKASAANSNIGFARIVNHVPGWWEGSPPPGFEGFTAAQAQDYQFWANIEPASVGTTWTKISVIDTVTTLNYPQGKNVFPEFGFSGDPKLFGIDKVELKVLGKL